LKHPVRDFIIGVTAIIGVVGLCVLLWLMGELSWFRTPSYTVLLRMDNAGGVLPAAPITLNGVRIGNIKSIKTWEDPRQGVVLALSFEQTVRVPKDISVAILRDLVGQSTLSLTAVPPKEGAAVDDATTFFKDGDTFTSKAYAPGLTGELSSLLDKRLGMVDTAVTKFNTLADTYTEVGKRVQVLLEPRVLADVEAGKAQGNLISTVERFDKAVADARGWLGDAGMKADAQGAVKKLSETLDRVAGLTEEWKKTAVTVSESAKGATDQFNKTAADLGTASRSLSEVINEVQKLVAATTAGEGTAGQLITNPDLFRNLNDAAVRLEQTLTEAKLLIEKYRKEGIPIQF
jgi:phospholipid/cholesterol/gamma-HCH transport system substrate-binding protein